MLKDCFYIKFSVLLLIVYLTYKMLQANKPPQFLEDSLSIEQSFSIINLIPSEINPEPKRCQLKLHSKVRPIDKNGGHKLKETNCGSRSASGKKSKSKEKSHSKSKKTSKKLVSKVVVNSKKQYKTIEAKPSEHRLRTKKSQKCLVPKRVSLESLFKKPEVTLRKKKGKEEMKGEKKSKTQKPKETVRTRLKKSKSENAMDRITLSEIAKARQLGSRKEGQVIHEYFGMEDKLSSIMEREEDKFKRTKTRLDKCKTRSSASSLSQRKGPKFSLKGGKIGK